MKPRSVPIALLFAALTTAHAFAQIDEPLLEGPYLGQKPPGSVAEVFAPGIVSTPHFDAFAVFSPDLNELYFVRKGGAFEKYTLVVFRYTNHRWRRSIIPHGVGEPFISPDGQTMYLGAQYMERTESGWSEVKSLAQPFKELGIMRLSVSAKGTWFFDERTKVGTIRYARLIDGRREAPKPLSNVVNTGIWTAHPFIAPDESYLIWDSEREGGFGGTDLYLSFRQKDGSWGTAINLGEKINSEVSDAYGTVTPDGKYLFFYREMGPGNLDIFWADAGFIETLRPK